VLLKTDTEAADQFYVSLGFVRLANNERATHLLDLKKKPNPESCVTRSRHTTPVEQAHD
jgi:hypothetical protein